MAPARRVTGRELLLGSSFRSVLGNDAGSLWTSWGQGASVSRFSAAVPGLDLSGEVGDRVDGHGLRAWPAADGVRDDAQRRRGTAEDEGWRYALGSTATMAMPYARLAADRPPLGVGARGHGHRAAFTRPRRQGGAKLPHGPRDDARGDGGAWRAGAARRGGRVRAGAEGGCVLGARGGPSGSRRPSSGTSRPHGASRAGCGQYWTARAPSLSQAGGG